MNKKLFFLLASTSVSFYSMAQKPNMDSLSREAAKTELYSPVPPIVTPGATAADAPSDAIILFDGTNLNAWHSDADSTKPAQWIVHDGMMTVNKKTGGIITKQRFMDYQLHLEWRIPENITGSDQARGNSGVFLANTEMGDVGYELQILDCYGNTTYVNGQTGSIYKQSIPLANACKKPGEWQTYDIIWKAPRLLSTLGMHVQGEVCD